MTINEAMVLQRAVRTRINDLTSIRNANIVEKRTWSYLGDGKPQEKVDITPKYDPKLVDKKIVELESFIFKVDTAIKRANAKTEIGIEADVDKLLEPIQ